MVKPAPRTYQLFIDAFAFEKRCEEFFQHICFSPVPRRAAPRRPVQPVEITSGQSSGATTILMIILYRELLPGRNKRTLDYRRASKRVTVVFVTRVCCTKMKIARANSLERLLITASSDTREQIGGKGDNGEKGRRQLSLTRGRGAGGEVWAPIFATRAVSGARDTPPPCKLSDEACVKSINQKD